MVIFQLWSFLSSLYELQKLVLPIIRRDSFLSRSIFIVFNIVLLIFTCFYYQIKYSIFDFRGEKIAIILLNITKKPYLKY